jgi:hypothetical protein
MFHISFETTTTTKETFLDTRKKLMENKLISVYQLVTNDLPDGKYEGTWSAYEVLFNIGENLYRGVCDGGVRGFNWPCTVTINKGSMTVESIR